MDKLKANLPRGYTKILAQRNNCTKQYISQIVNSDNIAHPIYKQALEMAKKHQKELRDIKQSITSL